MNNADNKKPGKPSIPASTRTGEYYTQAISGANNPQSDIFAVAVEEAKEWVDFLEL